MRRRNTTALLAGIAALMLVLPGTAFADDDEFTYRYLDEDGDVHVGSLVDPPSWECIEIPEVADLEDTYAFRPRNDTDSTAVVFKDHNCGSYSFFSLRPDGGKGSDRLKFRSVIFS
ncbi:hypothetical protein N8J89_01980 [Crossiella sp. CA-258035]|uniref:hypothetical protein n=1 Tax=Crossiella sp. CA-258035 TaxID=2981138 RepID=UPI0024BCCCA9|nr:hypothetical protein [Crossiella sp. CA-258035]WHT19872.1 hypothetical protein N8J89_01980 [Crossiella sp. CA-258035]